MSDERESLDYPRKIKRRRGRPPKALSDKPRASKCSIDEMMLPKDGGNAGFRKLPLEMRDRIISGLDERQITLLEASVICTKEGYPIGYETIRRYYQVLQARRRKEDFSLELQRCFQQLCEMRPDMDQLLHNKAIELFTCLAAGIMESIKSGSLDQKAAAKMIEALSPYLVDGVRADRGRRSPRVTIVEVPVETQKKLKEEIYGIE